MVLSNKQKKWILKNRSKLTPDALSKEMKLPREEVDRFLKASRSKPLNKMFFLVTILVPVIFFVLLELALRIFHYGYDYTQWVSPLKGEYILNTQIARKYFYNMQDVPRSDVDIFDIVKKPNSFRIFVLGESAAAGYPFLPNGSFSRYLQQRLSLEYPDSKIEVVNCAMTAINSYAMLDFMPGILKEKPDLIIIYAGNNEYYGALGVGSMESFGNSRTLVNLVIYLEQFRTFQLLRNVMNRVAGLFGKKQALTGTLMARMARNQYIGLDSKVYEEGLDQFKGNMTDILEMAKKQNVPVILGTLACNLKDQPPFVSIRQKKFPPADTVFRQAEANLAEKDYRDADSLFRYAKDLDALRFRAPTDLNEEIFALGKEFNYPVVNIDSAFDAFSPDHIVGDNLMTDHLHPTLHGYQLIGGLYYDEMERTGTLPKTKPRNLTNRQQDSITVSDFPFAGIDSVIGEYRIKVLKNDWPYIKPQDMIPIHKLLTPRNFIDTLAYDLVKGGTDWVAVHKDAAEYYALRDDYTQFDRVMRVLVSQYPMSVDYCNYAAAVLLHAKDYPNAYYYLARMNEVQPTAFSEKWLGIIDLSQNRVPSAKNHLSESLKYDSYDAQVWYNLAGVYVDEKNYPKALETIKKVLFLQPDFPGALALRDELQKASK